ncbi:DoxX family protein [Parasphingopyxis algicola]|uniref:DoxX family protein n=1 Tax=Parasphingopyxis algicola TaxID=2026624 RepID=UPI0015A142CA|nr:DoxX family protein [Parasphingopyxis algicola]QLC26839.1 DoxX family protein [Parasphingopyxis algicola]
MGERLPDGLMPLLQRLAISGVFWLSARTKVEGLSIKDSTFLLFEHEYALPIVPSDFAAVVATIAEHLFPILLVLGLFTRLSATALLIMTLVIQFLVYPGAWALHLTWIAILVPLIARGGGALSLDRLLKIP